ncbi:MAG: class I SAM-dependent methyltransferase [Oscillospiraceae bacterium]|nr:class I SAM-dependent methyltransferase [Oscillospiraceae bacterium]
MSIYGSFARFYDLLSHDVDYAAKAEHIASILDSAGIKEGILLDLACGTGMLSVRFADMGYDVIAVDGSAEMLSIAADERNRPNIIYICQRMEELELYGSVRAIVCMQDSLNHITDSAALQTAMSRAAEYLEPDGIFVFDVNSVYKHRSVLADNTFVQEHDGLYLVWRNQPLEDDITEMTLDIFEQTVIGYERYTEHITERAYGHDEIIDFIKTAGLVYIDSYDGDSFGPVAPDSQRILYITKRK